MSGVYKSKVIVELIRYIFAKDKDSDVFDYLSDHGLDNKYIEKIINEEDSDSEYDNSDSEELSENELIIDQEITGGSIDDEYLKGSIFYRGGNYSSDDMHSEPEVEEIKINSDDDIVINSEYESNITGGRLVAGSPTKEFKKLGLTSCECSTAVMDDIKNNPYKYNDSCLTTVVEEKIIDIVDEEDLIKIADKCDGSEKCLIKTLITKTDIIKEISVCFKNVNIRENSRNRWNLYTLSLIKQSDKINTTIVYY